MSESVKAYEEKLKKTIQSHFQQLKNGCSNKVCYNTHNCRNAYNFSNNSLLKLSDKELLMCSLKKVKQNDINSLICYNLSKYPYKSEIVQTITDWFSLLNNSSGIFDPRKIDSLNKVTITEINEINQFNGSMNEILTDCFPEIMIKNKHESVDCSVLPLEQRISLLELLIKINFNFLNYLLLTNNLNYTYVYIKNISDLFENFLKISNHYRTIKQIDKDVFEDQFFLNLFLGYSDNNNMSNKVNINSTVNFSVSLENLQNFLTVLILDLTGEDVLPTKNELKLLVGLMRLFEIFYHSNLSFEFVNKSLFENEKVNDHLSIKSQLKTYFEYHHNKKVESLHLLDVEIEHFSFIKYYYIYNTASKKEIISEYNICLQEKEMKMGLQNLDILFGGGLTLNIKVNRNNLIKSTLDIIIGNLNFRKPLKVRHFLLD